MRPPVRLVRRGAGARGFTLYELLLAFAILALLSAFAWTGFTQLAVATGQRDVAARRLVAIQLTLAQLERDLLQADGRGVREASHGSREPAFSGGASPYPLEFSRAGWRNPTATARAPTQRIAYALEGGAFVRYAWRVLDRAPGSEPQRRVLLDHVDGLDVEFLEGSTWRGDWPPPSDGPPADLRPHAVRIGLTLAGEGRIERVVELIGDTP